MLRAALTARAPSGNHALAEHLVCLWMLGQGDGGDIGAKDSGFLACDFRDGVAEILLVIEIDVGDYREDRFDDVCGIETAAHANFEDGDFDLGCGEVIEGHGRHGFKEAGQVGQPRVGNEWRGSSGNAVVGSSETVIRNGLAIDADTLIDEQQMRRGVEANAVR